MRETVTKRGEIELKALWFEQLQRQADIRRVPMYYRLFELGSQRIGEPDAYVVSKQRNAWLEFKLIYDLSHPVVHYEPGQLVALRNLRACGVFSATLAVTPGLDFYIAAPPRMLCNKPTASFNLLKCPELTGGFIEDIYDALELVLSRYYKE